MKKRQPSCQKRARLSLRRETIVNLAVARGAGSGTCVPIDVPTSDRYTPCDGVCISDEC